VRVQELTVPGKTKLSVVNSFKRHSLTEFTRPEKLPSTNLNAVMPPPEEMAPGTISAVLLTLPTPGGKEPVGHYVDVLKKGQRRLDAHFRAGRSGAIEIV
jgi:hypothetical protein